MCIGKIWFLIIVGLFKLSFLYSSFCILRDRGQSCVLPIFSGYERDEVFPQDTDLSPVPLIWLQKYCFSCRKPKNWDIKHEKVTNGINHHHKSDEMTQVRFLFYVFGSYPYLENLMLQSYCIFSFSAIVVRDSEQGCPGFWIFRHCAELKHVR